jgi:hypothetical protein
MKVLAHNLSLRLLYPQSRLLVTGIRKYLWEGCEKKWCGADSRNPDEGWATHPAVFLMAAKIKGRATGPSFAHPQCVEALLLTGFTDHVDVGDLQVTVLGAVVLHAGVCRCAFRVFLHVVHFGIRNHTFDLNGVTEMSRQIDCVVVVHFPRAAIAGGQPELVGTGALGKASGDASHLAL